MINNYINNIISKNINNKKKGFTLIELLIVISIIGTLATLSLVALNVSRVKARDVRRVADIYQIQAALEMYYLDNSSYPAGTLGNKTSLSSNGFSSSPSGVIYMSEVPTNPIPMNDGVCPSTSAYKYTRIGNGSSYTLSYCHSVTGPAVADPSKFR